MDTIVRRITEEVISKIPLHVEVIETEKRKYKV